MPKGQVAYTTSMGAYAAPSSKVFPYAAYAHQGFSTLSLRGFNLRQIGYILFELGNRHFMSKSKTSLHHHTLGINKFFDTSLTSNPAEAYASLPMSQIIDSLSCFEHCSAKCHEFSFYALWGWWMLRYFSAVHVHHVPSVSTYG